LTASHQAARPDPFFLPYASRLAGHGAKPGAGYVAGPAGLASAAGRPVYARPHTPDLRGRPRHTVAWAGPVFSWFMKTNL
jgi:hypothetical protein